MHLSLDNLKTEFASDQSTLSPAAMVIAVEGKKMALRAKGREFNCLVLHNGRDSAENQLSDFLKYLEANKATFPNNTRYQLLYRMINHWSVADVRVIEGQLEFFLLDAANSLPHVLASFIDIRTHCPEARLHYCGPTLQNDNDNCAYFALDHAVCLSKLPDLYEQIRDVVDGISADPDFYFNYINSMVSKYPDDVLLKGVEAASALDVVRTVQYIRCDHLPQTFGSLFKNIQSISMYGTMFRGKEYKRRNGAGLDAYIDKHMVLFKTNVSSLPKQRNDAIDYKKLKLQEAAMRYLAAHQEIWTETVQALQKKYGLLFDLTALAQLKGSTPDTNEYEIAGLAEMMMSGPSL